MERRFVDRSGSKAGAVQGTECPQGPEQRLRGDADGPGSAGRGIHDSLEQGERQHQPTARVNHRKPGAFTSHVNVSHTANNGSWGLHLKVADWHHHSARERLRTRSRCRCAGVFPTIPRRILGRLTGPGRCRLRRASTPSTARRVNQSEFGFSPDAATPDRHGRVRCVQRALAAWPLPCPVVPCLVFVSR